MVDTAQTKPVKRTIISIVALFSVIVHPSMGTKAEAGMSAPSPPDLECAPVQPGALVTDEYEIDDAPTEGSVAVNFLFRGSDGSVYAGLPGVIVLHPEFEYGTYTWKGRSGPDVFDSEERLVGDAVYSTLEPMGGPEGYRDYTLVKIRPGVEWDPNVCGLEGPTGIEDRTIPSGKIVDLWFTGSELDQSIDGVEQRAVADGMPRRDYVMATGTTDVQIGYGAVFLGPDGVAIGHLCCDTFGLGPTPDDSRHEAGHNLRITRVQPQIRAAERVLGMQFRMILGRR